MAEWVAGTEKERSLHPLLVIGVFVVVFLEIHPFQDGNGRLSRILTTLMLLRAGYAYVPYSSLESVIEQSKESYHLSLRQTQGTIRTEAPDWNPWLEFFLRALQSQKQRLEKKMEREHGRVTMAEAVRVSGASRNTIKEHLRALVEQRHLVLHGAGRGAWYGLT